MLSKISCNLLAENINSLFLSCPKILISLTHAHWKARGTRQPGTHDHLSARLVISNPHLLRATSEPHGRAAGLGSEAGTVQREGPQAELPDPAPCPPAYATRAAAAGRFRALSLPGCRLASRLWPSSADPNRTIWKPRLLKWAAMGTMGNKFSSRKRPLVCLRNTLLVFTRGCSSFCKLLSECFSFFAPAPSGFVYTGSLFWKWKWENLASILLLLFCKPYFWLTRAGDAKFFFM